MRNKLTIDQHYEGVDLSKIDAALSCTGVTLHIHNVCVAKTKGRWGIETHIQMPCHSFVLHASIDDSTLVMQIDKGNPEEKGCAWTELIVKVMKYDRVTLERYARNYIMPANG